MGRVRKALVGVAVAAAVAAAAVFTPAPAKPVDLSSLHGAHVFYAPGAPAIDPARLDYMFYLAAVYWNTEDTALNGYSIIVKGYDPYPLGDTWVWGVTFPDLKRLEFAQMNPACPEIVFIHEFGHGGAGIHNHDDPRFEDPAIMAFLAEAGICRF